MKKNPEERYASASAMGRDLKQYLESLQTAEMAPHALLQTIRKPRIAVPLALGLLLLCVAGGWFLQRQSKIRWAREQALPEIERLVLANELDLGNFSNEKR
ncbi:MAG: hypothetical protein MUC42_15515 [Bryobacter sp.]|nr:hypothetical protein [Bryobacter sp.]